MATYVLNDAKMFSDIADDIAIVINSETGIYYGMNGFGTAIFENLLNGVGSEKIVAALTALPGAPEDMESRLNTFVNKLKDFEIILEESNRSTDVETNIDAAIAQADAFKPMVARYDDAQELLLADPIHEIKEDSGWQPDKAALETDEQVVAKKKEKIIE